MKSERELIEQLTDALRGLYGWASALRSEKDQNWAHLLHVAEDALDEAKAGKA